MRVQTKGIPSTFGRQQALRRQRTTEGESTGLRHLLDLWLGEPNKRVPGHLRILKLDI